MDGVEEEVIEGDCTPGMDSGVVVKKEPAWSMKEDSQSQPSAVYSTAQHMSDNTSGSLLSRRVCQHCSAAFVLVSSLELHLASVHGEPLPFPEWTEGSDRQMSLPHGRLSTEETDHVREYSADSAVEFVMKLEPAWSTEEDCPDQPSVVYNAAQPMSDNTSGSLLYLKRGCVCQHCSSAFVLVSSLELHLASIHGEKLHMVLPGSSTPDRCDAGDCSNTYIDKEVISCSSRKATINKELNNKGTGDRYGEKRSRQNVCDICGKSFTKPSDLRRHLLIHSGVKPFVCDVCSKSFTQTGSLKTHKLSHTGHKPFVCDVCSKSFTRASSLKKHKLTHGSHKPFVCDVCSKNFVKAGNLKTHKLLHSGHKPFVCDVCSKNFAKAGSLKRHKLLHSSNKRHICSDCGKRFGDSSVLKRHRMTHTGSKPFVCATCQKGFVKSSDLKRHYLTHTGEKPHVCSDCGKSFSLSTHLTRHRQTHLKDKLHGCPHCPAAFKWSKQLKRHVKEIHCKLEPAWSMEEDSPDHPSAVYSTAQPMSNNTSGSLLSLNTSRVCQHCSAAFVLVSSLELHLASVHGEPLPFPEWTESSDGQMSLPHGRLSTEETDHVREYSADSAVEFVVKLEPAWSMKEDSPDQPSAVYSTAQPMSGNTSGSLLSLKRGRVCQRCSAAFVLVSSLELHLASVHGEKLHMVLPGSSTPDRCDAGDCSNIYIDMGVTSCSSRKTPKKKINNGTGDGYQRKRSRHNVCDICGKSFTKPSDLRRHLLIHSGVKPFVCDVCNKSFTQAGSLKTHKLTHGSHKPFVCDVCSESFTRASHLKKHKLTHGSLKPFVCDVCSESFTRASHLKKHKLTHDDGPKRFPCDICTKTFTRACDAKKHTRVVHSEERPYKCPHCASDFKWLDALRIHVKSVHDTDRPFLCDICGAAFARTGDLTTHKRIHTGEKPFVCSDCGKGFTKSSDIQRHRLTHTRIKRHLCSDCGKGFGDTSSLKRHRMTHTGSKPFVCAACQKGFVKSSDLKRHYLTHTGKKPHVCSDCGKSFSLSIHLTRHRVTHTEDNPHICPHCPAAFKWSKQLKRHMKKMHP